jgi:hypothetical protein
VRARLLLAVICLVGYPVAAFRPFSFAPPASRNAAHRGAAGELVFTDTGLARSGKPPDWVAEARATGALELVLTVQAAVADQTGPARIFTLSRDLFHRNLTVAQDGRALVVRLRTPQTSAGGVPGISLPDVFAKGARTDVHLSIRPGRLLVRAGPERRLETPLPAEPLSTWDLCYEVALGNELTGNRPWRGSILRAQVKTARQTTDYLAPDALRVPWLVWHPHQPLKLLPFRNTAPLDALVNLLGFMPLGWLLATARRPWSWRRTVVTALLASATIELAQLFIPARVPSLTDVILNGAGGLAGWAIAQRVAPGQTPGALRPKA